MATERAAQGPALWRVEVWVPDETETTKVPGNVDHNRAMNNATGDLLRYAKQRRLVWLVRDDTELDYPRADGSAGSLFPDLIMARDVEVPPTEPYDILTVGKPPDLIIEVLSPSTAAQDRDKKLTAYAQMGIGEYLIFDPRPRGRPLLAGYRLVRWGEYEPIPAAWGGGVWLRSLELRALPEPANDDPETGHGPRIRFFTQDGEPLLHEDEEMARAEHINQEYARIRQEHDQIRQDYAQISQDYQAERDARMRAEQERAAAEAELARLRASLGNKDHQQRP